jgi:hypothetical protein
MVKKSTGCYNGELLLIIMVVVVGPVSWDRSCFPSSTGTIIVHPPVLVMILFAQLQKLADLNRSCVLSDEEFASSRKKFMGL